MTKIHDEVLAANKAYASDFGPKGVSGWTGWISRPWSSPPLGASCRQQPVAWPAANPPAAGLRRPAGWRVLFGRGRLDLAVPEARDAEMLAELDERRQLRVELDADPLDQLGLVAAPFHIMVDLDGLDRCGLVVGQFLDVAAAVARGCPVPHQVDWQCHCA